MAAGLFNMTSSRQHEFELHSPALCEELRIRDILDNVAVMTSGAFVAAYELSGVHSYYHTEDMRNRAKESLEAVLRSLPEPELRLSALRSPQAVEKEFGITAGPHAATDLNAEGQPPRSHRKKRSAVPGSQ